MEVTNKSFQQNLPSIIQAIQSCDYYAIDTEYSGFAISQRDKASPYDSLQTRYQKIKFLCQNHLGWQIGLSTFKYDADTMSYQCMTYSFPIFPNDSKMSNRSFIITSNALRFLYKYHFSFYKTITEGIGFQQAAKKKEVINAISDVLLNKDPLSDVKIHPGKESKKEISKIKERLSDWLLKEEDSISIEYSSEFIKDCLLESDYFKHLKVNIKIEPNKLILTKNTSTLKITVPNMDESQITKELLYKEEMGISLLVSELVKCKKPLVGHNFMYDLAFFYYQFIDDFPDTYEQYKERLHECFPIVYDTKIIANTLKDKFPCTDLETIIKKLPTLNKSLVKFTFPSGFANLEESDAVHDAGFDAYCTGKAFAIMAKLVELDNSLKYKGVSESKIKQLKDQHKVHNHNSEDLKSDGRENRKKIRKEKRQETIKLNNKTNKEEHTDIKPTL